MPKTANARAALFMMLSMAAFTFNDATSKWLTTELGVGQIMLLRGLVACLLLALLASWQGVFMGWRTMLHPAVIARSLMEVLGTVTFLFALPFLPLSNASAIYQALPLAVTLGAALFLNEPVGWRRWLAIIVGFGGVMLIVRPGLEGFTIYSVIIVVSVFFSAIRDLLTRKMPPDVPTFLVAFAASIGVTITGGILVPFQGGLVPVTSSELIGIIAAAVFLLTGYSTLIVAMRSGEVSFVAPFRYTALIVAITVGYFAFNEHPDALMLTGAAIVVASGIYTFYRERVRGAEKELERVRAAEKAGAI
jgi:drug/metabolite transporter (DMT)-like permease